ncbi:LON peptidase substrate-binding domain-containing protein [uncultured Alsobacter sp.]|uniref:LON peptidase substrate-binding domain-containing protein n=1 Tax=uncultured Alsobacter sp. TaxID=1748258 RepID=UPI0025F1AB11|nr:LON peptidase substrate-binding domain-containing protein [uncultured Alsobacter sp.]
MRDFREAKAMAQSLRRALSARSVDLTHSESQELVARMLGVRDWNVLAASIKAARSPSPPRGDTPPVATGTGIPVVPMRDLVLFPHMVSRIFVGRAKTREAVERAIVSDRRVLLVAQRHARDDRPATADALHPVGVVANVIDRQTQADGALKVTVCGLRRASLVRLFDDEFLSADVTPIEEEHGQTEKAAALSQAVLDAYQIYADVDFTAVPPGSRARFGLPSIGNPSLLADMVAPLLAIGIDQKQALLETTDVETRLARLVDLMSAGRPAASEDAMAR